MIRVLRKATFFSKALTTCLALLVSNLVLLSCALAIELASCPEHPPVHCVEMYDASATVSIDEWANNQTEKHKFFAVAPYSQSLPVKRQSVTVSLRPADRPKCNSPPHYLLNCTFLK